MNSTQCRRKSSQETHLNENHLNVKQYPYIDKGELALKRAKPKPSQEHAKYIERVAGELI